MEEEEAVNKLLSGTDSWDEDDDAEVYRMINGSHSKKGGLMKKRKKHDAKHRMKWLWRGTMGISLVANIVFLVIVIILTKNIAHEGDKIDDEIFVQACSPAPSSSPSSSVQSNLPSTSTTNSQTNMPNGPKIQISKTETGITQTQLQHQQQQNEQKQQLHQETVACQQVPACGANKAKTVMKEERERENIFADLTPGEMLAVYNYLQNEPKINVKKRGESKSCYVWGVEVYPPNKTKALLYLDSYAPKPAREAQVMLSCEHLQIPVMREIVVGPLPNPTYYVENPRRRESTIPFKFNPSYGINDGYDAVLKALATNQDMQRLILESYGVTLTKCHPKCISFLPQKTSSAYDDAVVVTITAYYATEFNTINPLDLIFVTKELIPNGKMFYISTVFYGGRSFSSVNELVAAYHSGTVAKTQMSFPAPKGNETSIPGTLNLRGPIFPEEPQAGPKSFEPDGKRYSINGQHVNYLKWSFSLRLSKLSGPQLWDVRWGGERIAYEISLQDVAVIYAGANPTSFFSHLSDSAFGLGNKASGLLPGLDCPEGADFLSQSVFGPYGTSITLPHSQCIFEHNTELPLRRHRNRDGANGHNHAGLVDRVLIVRTILVEYNYDYIFDMVFHQNGAVELKAYASGYVMSQHYYNGEKPFGFRIHEQSVGSIHHHIFNFKIDMDILGTSNRYETLDMGVDERTWPWYHEGKDPFKQISFKHNLRRTEMDAVLRYDFSKPKYHIVYNDERKNKFGVHRAYRIATKGFSKQILPDDSPVLNSRAWSKYEMLTTRRRDEEETSSSIFSMMDGAKPHVNIDWYLQDNETIVDEDLVFWITVGMHHIPHTEDIPNTPTLGTEASILLTPYNYFPECPSVGSRDSIRVEEVKKKVIMKDYGVNVNKHCVPKAFDYNALFSKTHTLYS